MTLGAILRQPEKPRPENDLGCAPPTFPGLRRNHSANVTKAHKAAHADRYGLETCPVRKRGLQLRTEVELPGGAYAVR